MIDIFQDGMIRLLEINPDDTKRISEEIISNDINAVIIQHPLSKKCIIIDKRFKKRLESEDLGKWKEKS